MVSNFLKTILLCYALLLAATGLAQPVQVSVALAPPYPVHLEEYIQMKGQIIVTLVNTSATPLQLRLVPSVKGPGSVSATLKPGYRPATPLLLGPLETRVLTGGQLQALNMGLSLENLNIQGVSVQQIIRTETLPEGLFDFCIRAFDYQTETQLSKDGSGCAMFQISWYDPPVVVQPADGAAVAVLNPQFLNLGWTPSGLGGITRYRLQLMDLSLNNLFNPNDAFNMGFPPFFEKDNLLTLGYPLTLAEPPLTPGHKYAVRVQAYDPQGKLQYKNNGYSAVSTFTYGLSLVANPSGNNGGGIDLPFGDFSNPPQPPQFNTPDPNDPNTCTAAFEVPMPSGATSYQPKVQDTIVLGKFKLVIKNIAAGNGDGTVYIPFLKTKVKVKFQNLQVNGQRQAYGNSKAWADIDQPNLIEQAMANDPTGQMNDVQVKDLHNYILNAQKQVSKFSGENAPPTGMPFSLDNAKAQQFILLGLIFTPTAAYANAVFGMPVQDALNNQWLQIGKKGIGIRPNGFGLNALKIGLGADKTIPLTDKTSMVFKGGADNSYVSFDCQGINKVQIKGALEFARELVLPLDQQGKAVPAPTRLAAQFSATVEHQLNWTASATFSHPKFALPGLNDIVLSAQNLLLDQSDIANVPGMQFPANHPKYNKANNKDWKGLYLGACSVQFPNWMKGKNNSDVSLLDLKDLLMDKTGLWVKISKIGEILKLGDGSMAGWGFSLDTVRLDIQASQLAGGGIGGKIRIPVTKAGLKYSATITKGDPEAAFGFSVKTEGEITIDAFIAKASLQPNSWLSIQSEGGQYRPEAMLHGAITVGWKQGDANAPKTGNVVNGFQLPELKFSDFHIRNNEQGKPQILSLTVPFDNNNVPKSNQSNLAGFPLKLGGISVSTQTELCLAFGLDVTLSKGETGKNGLSGSVGFRIFGKYDEAQKLFVYDRTRLDSISIDMDISVAKVQGSLWMYEGNDTYGNGFKGSISADIKSVGTKVAVTLQAGTKGSFDYFYFDGMAQFGAGFQIPGTMASIYGFGGGVWYNMSRGALPVYTFDEYNKPKDQSTAAGSSYTGVQFTPKNGSSGFSARVIFGLSGGQKAAASLNGDLELSMFLSKHFGLDSIVLKGNVYAMQKINDRGNAKVHGSAYMKMDMVTPSFTLNAGLTVAVGGILNGSANLNMHFSPQQWYINLGTWDTDNTQAQDVPWDYDMKRCSLGVKLMNDNLSVKFVGYFMMGSKMPELPPLPLAIRSKMKGQNGQVLTDSREGFPEFKGNNPGFAFGVACNTHFEVKALILYASLDFILGFDVLLKQYDDSQICEGTSLGINNWYAQGQAFAQLGIHAGIDINLFVWKGRWELFFVEATAYLYGSFPNPNYFRGNISVHGEALNGLIKVNKSFDFETGKKPCMNSNPFGDYPIVSDMNPKKMDGKNDRLEVHEDIRLAFNFPRGKFKVWNPETPEVPARTCWYNIEKFSVKHGSKEIAFKPIEYLPDGMSARYVTDGAYFPEETTLKYYLEVKGYAQGEGALTTEKYSFNFDTGKRPDKIQKNQLQAACPLPKQRYFLKKSVSQGFVQWQKGEAIKQDYLFKNTDDGGGLYDLSKTRFYICFTELVTNKRIYRPFSTQLNQDKITFEIPAELKNETLYSMAVVKEMTTKPKPKNIDEETGGGGGWGQGGQNEQGQWEYESGQFTNAEWKQITEGAYRINRSLVPDTSVKKVFFNLYTQYFRTSKFNTLPEKMATYQMIGQSEVAIEYGANMVKRGGSDENPVFSIDDFGKVKARNPILFLSGAENFDTYDAFGYAVIDGGQTIQAEPLLTRSMAADAKFPTFMYDQYSNRRNLYDSDFINKVEIPDRHKGDPLLPAQVPSMLELRNIGNWDQMIDFWRSSKWGSIQPYKPANLQVGMPAPALSDQEIEAAKALAPPQGNGNIGNFAINVQAPNNGFPMPNLNLSSGDKICIPVVNYASVLAARDYRHYMNRGWGHVRTHYNYSSQQSFLGNAYDYMQDYLVPRAGRTYKITLGGKTFSYQAK